MSDLAAWLLQHQECRLYQVECGKTPAPGSKRGWRGSAVQGDLAAFLLACITDDEQAAKAATPGPWHWDPEFDNSPKPSWDPGASDKGLALVNPDGAEVVGAYNYHCCDFRMDPNVGDEDQAHIARWDPARALAEGEAKRRIVELHTVDDVMQRCAEDQARYPCPTLRLLAAPYADRPGYQESWRP